MVPLVTEVTNPRTPLSSSTPTTVVGQLSRPRLASGGHCLDPARGDAPTNVATPLGDGASRGAEEVKLPFRLKNFCLDERYTRDLLFRLHCGESETITYCNMTLWKSCDRRKKLVNLQFVGPFAPPKQHSKRLSVSGQAPSVHHFDSRPRNQPYWARTTSTSRGCSK
jgi:hypothetical protein